MPFDPQQAANLRTKLGDKAAADALYNQDPTFRQRMDYVRGNIQGRMNPLKEHSLYKQTLDAHYKGARFGRPTNQTLKTVMDSGSDVSAPAMEPDESFSVLKTIKNVPASGMRFISDVTSGLVNVFNPDMEKNTVVNLGKMLIGSGGNTVETIAGAMGVENPEDLMNLPGEELASAVGQFYADRYGGVERVLKTVQEDPVGFLADVSLAFTAGGTVLKGAGAATKAAGLTKAGSTISKVGRAVDPLKYAGKAVKGTVKGVKNALSTTKLHASSLKLAPSDIRAISKGSSAGMHPSKWMIRNRVHGSIDEMVDKLDEIHTSSKTMVDDGLARITKTYAIVDQNTDDIAKASKPVKISTADGAKITTRGGDLHRFMSMDDWVEAQKTGFIPLSSGDDAGKIYFDAVPDNAKIGSIPYGSDEVHIIVKAKDAGKLLLDKKMKGGTAVYAQQPISVDKVRLATQPGPKSLRVGQSLEVLDDLYRDSPGNEAVLNRIVALKKKGSLTLKEINEVKRMLDEADQIFSNSGDVKVGAKARGLSKIRGEMKTFIEKEAAKEGFDAVKKLNKDTQVSFAVREALKKSSDRASNRNVFGLTDTIVGVGALGVGFDPFTAVGAVIAKNILGSPKVRTWIATRLSQLDPSSLAAVDDFLKTKKISAKASAALKKIAKPLEKLSKIEGIETILGEGAILPERTQ